MGPLNSLFSFVPFPVGTPPRVDGKTIDYSRLVPQPGDIPAAPFSYMHDSVPNEV